MLFGLFFHFIMCLFFFFLASLHRWRIFSNRTVESFQHFVSFAMKQWVLVNLNSSNNDLVIHISLKGVKDQILGPQPKNDVNLLE